MSIKYSSTSIRILKQVVLNMKNEMLILKIAVLKLKIVMLKPKIAGVDWKIPIVSPFKVAYWTILIMRELHLTTVTILVSQHYLMFLLIIINRLMPIVQSNFAASSQAQAGADLRREREGRVNSFIRLILVVRR